MRCEIIEAETREEVMQEMAARMSEMQKMNAKRLQNAVRREVRPISRGRGANESITSHTQAELNEVKTNAKIDLLHQFGAFNAKKRNVKEEESGSAEEVSTFGSRSNYLLKLPSFVCEDLRRRER